MNILYAAQNCINSKVQLSRFLQNVNPKHTIKIAAFKKSTPSNVQVDWTLDALVNIFYPKKLNFENENFEIYYNQVKNFSPDLIISDLEFFTSEIAIALNIPLWQVSSSLINHALTREYKNNLGVYKRYSALLYRDSYHNQKLNNIQQNSNLNLIYSHFGDCSNPPSIKSNYEWVRPYYKLGKPSLPCKHNIMGASLKSNKKILNILNSTSDSVYFTNFIDETYSNVLLKNIYDEKEYYCNLFNSELFICAGELNLLADAFYNKKYSITISDEDPDCIVNATISEKLGLSNLLLNNHEIKEINNSFNDKIKFLHEKL